MTASKAAIYVAIIGLVGTLGAAVISTFGPAWMAADDVRDETTVAPVTDDEIAPAAEGLSGPALKVQELTARDEETITPCNDGPAMAVFYQPELRRVALTSDADIGATELLQGDTLQISTTCRLTYTGPLANEGFGTPKLGFTVANGMGDTDE
ncbi:MAG: hypothetical protein AAF762_11200 [Pseudomonadota bacterium]